MKNLSRKDAFLRISAGIQAIFYGIVISNLTWLPYVQAAPNGGTVVGGTGSISQSGANTTINQTSQNMAIDWSSYNVNSDERVQYIQPNRSSLSLNRILSNSASEIRGRIDANGQVILINPHGLIFTDTATINVGGIVASTLDIQPSAFMNGDFIFNEVPGTDGKVVNSGIINASVGGNVVLMGKQVQNDGLIMAKLGSVNLAAGKEAVLTFDNEGLVGVRITKEVLQDEIGIDPAVINNGKINAEGGRVLLTASVSQDVFSQAVNNNGLNQATSVVVHPDGTFTLGGGADVINIGTIDVSKSTDTVNDPNVARIVLIGENVTSSGTLRADNASGNGGEIELHANNTTLLTGNSLTSARSEVGGRGGIVKVLGDKVGLFDQAVVDVSGDLGGGQALIGGDYQGKNPFIRNANKSIVGREAQVLVNAINQGDGGKAVIWADQDAWFYGYINAQGGAVSGNGGLVETSGKLNLSFDGLVDLAANNGIDGKLLLDPLNIQIVTGDAANTTLNNNQITATSDLNVLFADGGAATFQITAARLVAVLATGNVELQAAADIEVNAAITANNGNTNNLTLVAGDDIFVYKPISLSGGDLTLVAGNPGGNQVDVGNIYIMTELGGVGADTNRTGSLSTTGIITLHARDNVYIGGQIGSTNTSFRPSGITVRAGDSIYVETIANNGYGMADQIDYNGSVNANGMVTFTAGDTTLQTEAGSLKTLAPINPVSGNIVVEGNIHVNNDNFAAASKGGYFINDFLAQDINTGSGSVQITSTGKDAANRGVILGNITANNLRIDTSGVNSGEILQSVDAARNLTVSANSTFIAGGHAISLKNTSNSLSGDINMSSTGGGIWLENSTATTSLNNLTIAGGDLTVNAATDLDLKGLLTITGGSHQLNAGLDLDLISALSGATDLNLTANRHIFINNSIDLSNSLSMSARGDVEINSAIGNTSAPTSFTLIADSNTNGTGDAVLKANVTVNGDFNVTGENYIGESSGNTRVTVTTTGTGSITLDMAGYAWLGEMIVAGDLTVTSGGEDANGYGIVQGKGDAITTGDTLTVTGISTFTSNNTNADIDLNNNNNLQGEINLFTTGTYTAYALLRNGAVDTKIRNATTAGNLVINATQNLFVTGTITAAGNDNNNQVRTTDVDLNYGIDNNGRTFDISGGTITTGALGNDIVNITITGGTGGDSFITDATSSISTSNGSIILEGAQGNDRFEMLGGTFSASTEMSVNGNRDNDEIIITNAQFNNMATLTLNGNENNDRITIGSGTLFTGVTDLNMIGGTGNDTFDISGNNLSGAANRSIDGGSQINADVVIAGNNLNMTLGDTSINSNGVPVAISNIERIETQNGTLRSGNTDTTWNITGQDSGTITETNNTANTLAFSGFTTLSGGNRVDRFQITGNGAVSGNVSGGGGDDRFELSGNGSVGVDINGDSGNDAFILAGNSSVTGNLNGGGNDDTFEISGNGSVAGNINGDGGNDILRIVLGTGINQNKSIVFNGTNGSNYVEIVSAPGINAVQQNLSGVFTPANNIVYTDSNTNNNINLQYTNVVDVSDSAFVQSFTINGRDNLNDTIVLDTANQMDRVRVNGNAPLLLANKNNVIIDGLTGNDTVRMDSVFGGNISGDLTLAAETLTTNGNSIDANGLSLMGVTNAVDINTNLQRLAVQDSANVIIRNGNRNLNLFGLSGTGSLQIFAGDVTSTASLNKTDVQTLSIDANSIRLTGNNSFAGNVTLDAGTVELNNSIDTVLTINKASNLSGNFASNKLDVTAGSNLGIGRIDAGEVKLTVIGQIADSSVDDITDIKAAKLTIQAGNGIGTDLNALELEVGEFNISNGSGVINIANVGDVQVKQLTNKGHIGFFNVGDVYITQINAGYNTGILTFQVDQGSVFGVGVIPDVIAMEADVSVSHGNLGVIGRPIYFQVRDRLDLFSQYSIYTTFGGSDPDINDQSLATLPIVRGALSGQQLIEVESLSEIDPAIFTHVQNYTHDEIAINLPDDQKQAADDEDEYRRDKVTGQNL
ncbi:MAG: filamentous hemagglutinin N-terminal domain-containing protein [Gammaproteobacteria bacterium]|nr:filamentous hemagglutinin N-terminal domain-containing protein [Gammaproteobacteria bacterium]MDH5653762.1 filamentous hemagglutinin N-terminal domain-containing protein [Gammaproteobacteria bacterium]